MSKHHRPGDPRDISRSLADEFHVYGHRVSSVRYREPYDLAKIADPALRFQCKLVVLLARSLQLHRSVAWLRLRRGLILGAVGRISARRVSHLTTLVKAGSLWPVAPSYVREIFENARRWDVETDHAVPDWSGSAPPAPAAPEFFEGKKTRARAKASSAPLWGPSASHSDKYQPGSVAHWHAERDRFAKQYELPNPGSSPRTRRVVVEEFVDEDGNVQVAEYVSGVRRLPQEDYLRLGGCEGPYNTSLEEVRALMAGPWPARAPHQVPTYTFDGRSVSPREFGFLMLQVIKGTLPAPTGATGEVRPVSKPRPRKPPVVTRPLPVARTMADGSIEVVRRNYSHSYTPAELSRKRSDAEFYPVRIAANQFTGKPAHWQDKDGNEVDGPY